MDIDALTCRDLADTATAKQIVSELKTRSPTDRVMAVIKMTVIHPLLAMRMCKCAIDDEESLTRVLEHGFQTADLSDISFYLEACAPRLPLPLLSSIIERAIEENTNWEAIEGAFYCLPRYIPEGDFGRLKAQLFPKWLLKRPPHLPPMALDR